MNKLPLQTRVQILQLLCEGSSMRSITRITGVSINTVAKLLEDAGRVCMTFHDEKVVNVTCKRVQVDEIWSFTYAKQKNVETAKAAPENAGDTWTWTAIDAETKMIMSWLVGPRDSASAIIFMKDVSNRISGRVQITSDGLKTYIDAVDASFGGMVDYAMLVKTYGATPAGAGRYSPPECTGIRKYKVSGNPKIEHVSTSFVERQNLTMRMHMRRFTRLTNGFSKKVERHIAAVSLYFVFYNWIKIHKTLRVTPAMAANLTDKLMSFEDLVALIDAATENPNRPSRYKTKKNVDDVNS